MKDAPHLNAEGKLVLTCCGWPLTQHEVRAWVRGIDAGHLDALRHYAEHGVLPAVAPVWGGLRLDRLSTGHTGWHVVTPSGKLIATVTQPTPPSGRWLVTIHGSAPSNSYGGDTAQEAVDAARAALAAFWGLST
jgi:hypothetical protein